jgi:hypothetical protein
MCFGIRQLWPQVSEWVSSPVWVLVPLSHTGTIKLPPYGTVSRKFIRILALRKNHLILAIILITLAVRMITIRRNSSERSQNMRWRCYHEGSGKGNKTSKKRSIRTNVLKGQNKKSEKGLWDIDGLCKISCSSTVRAGKGLTIIIMGEIATPMLRRVQLLSHVCTAETPFQPNSDGQTSHLVCFFTCRTQRSNLTSKHKSTTSTKFTEKKKEWKKRRDGRRGEDVSIQQGIECVQGIVRQTQSREGKDCMENLQMFIKCLSRDKHVGL